MFESLLDAMREHKVATTPDVVQILLRASDALTDIVDASRNDRPIPDAFAVDIVAAMEEALHGSADHAPVPSAAAATIEAPQASGEKRYQIVFTPHS